MVACSIFVRFHCPDYETLTWYKSWIIPTLTLYKYSVTLPTTQQILSFPVGWSNFSKSSQIEPPFLYSMCMGDTRSHTKFQVSSLNILEWRPLFVNWSWHWRSHLKWPERGTFDLAPFMGIKNALQNGITLGVLDFRKYVKRL